MSAAFLDSLKTAIDLTNVAGGFLKLFEDRVWLDRAPADANLPLCVYTVSTVRNASSKAGREIILRAVFSMYAKADTTDDLVEGQIRLKTMLDGKAFTATGHDRMVCRMLSQGVPRQEDDAWVIEDEYELRGTRTS